MMEEQVNLPGHKPKKHDGFSYGDITLHGSSTMHLGDVVHIHQPGNVNLNSLRTVDEASFDAYGQVHRACHSSTRVDLLREIQDWIRNPHGRNIFWLSGMAGTGKSTIATTVAQWLVSQRGSSSVDLGASFFFKRGEGDRGSAKWFIPTIVKQLILGVPGLDIVVSDVLASYPDICNKALAEQFRTLLLEPLQKVVHSSELKRIVVVVVDALDECENENDIRILLRLWSSIPPVTILPLKLFLTSRPEWPIRLGFKKMDGDKHQDVVIHEVPRPIIQHDIQVFLEHEIDRIREEYNEDSLYDTQLAPDWPGHDILQKLIDTAVPLFIVAATICRFLELDFTSPQEQLRKLLQFQATGHLSQMRKTYMPVLNQWKSLVATDLDESQIYVDFQTIVGAVVTVAEPLSMGSLAILLNVPIEVVAARLKPMHAVLEVPTDSSSSVRPLHLSLAEFLSGRELQNQPFYIDPATTHGMLLTNCLRIMSADNGLRENLCNLPYPGYFRQDIESDVIQQQLSPALRYACRYWVHHAQHSLSILDDNSPVYVFLQNHFLHWLEALSLLDRLADSFQHIGLLRSLLKVGSFSHRGAIADVMHQPQNAGRLGVFLQDAYRFMLANRHVVELAPLQIYSSSVIFAPQESIVRNVCGRTPTWIKEHSVASQQWSSELQTLEGHDGYVYAVAFSHDGKLLASASADKTVKVWDLSTGQTTQTYCECDFYVFTVFFSSDDKQLAYFISPESDAAASIGKIRDLNTGQVLRTFEANVSFITSAIFTHDGRLLASGADGNDVWLWDATSDKVTEKLPIKPGLEPDVLDSKTLTFSYDGTRLCCGFETGLITIWHVSTCQVTHELYLHKGPIEGLTFSQDDSLLVSASTDGTIKLWDFTTGQTIRELDHSMTMTIFGVSLSRDCKVVAIFGYSIQLLDVETGQMLHRMKSHTSPIAAAAFSHSNAFLASASGDGTIRIWEITNCGANQDFMDEAEVMKTDIAFLPDRRLLAAMHLGDNIRIMDTNENREICAISARYNPSVWSKFSPSGRLFVVETRNESIEVYDTLTGKAKHILEYMESCMQMMFSASEKILVSTDSDNAKIGVWDLATGQLTFHLATMERYRELEGTNYWPVVALSDDDTLVAIAGGTTVIVQGLVSNEMSQTTVESINGIGFSHSGKLLAIALFDDKGTVNLWDFVNDQIVQTISGFDEYAVSLYFSPDDTTLFARSNAAVVSSARRTKAKLESEGGHSIELKSGWIYQDGIRLLWLPSTYRKSQWIFRNDTLAVALDSGLVGTLQVDYPGNARDYE